jgi:hypothetical protein
VFSDTVFNAATDVPNGSLEISQVGGLTAVLGSFKNVSDSDTADTVLRNSIEALETVVEALPPSQILVNGTFLDQARFSISNAIPQLNLSSSIWEWLVQPRWSDLQRDPMRVHHARAGHLPLDPASDCLCYLPMLGSPADLSLADLHLVQVDTSAPQGEEYGVYEDVPSTVTTRGFPLTNHVYLFPNRSVPSIPLSSSGIGWPADASSSFLLEWQIFVPADCSTGVILSSDANLNESSENIIFVNLDSVTSELQLRWDDKKGTNNFNRILISNVVSPDQDYSVAIQKSPNADVVRVYLNGRLEITETIGTPLSTIDVVRFQAFRTGTPVIREFNARSSPVYPEIPFGPGGVRYSTGNPTLRWNSYML